MNAYFAEEVDIRQEYVESSYVMNLGYIAEILNETKEGEVTYTVTSGDSYYSIAEKYDLSVEALMKLNPGYDPKILRVGDVLTISNAVPYLTVVNVGGSGTCRMCRTRWSTPTTRPCIRVSIRSRPPACTARRT